MRWTGPTNEGARADVASRPFAGPDPFHELAFPTTLAAHKAIADELRLPLAKLSDDDRAFVTDLLGRTLAKPEVMAAVRERFPRGQAVARATS